MPPLLLSADFDPFQVAIIVIAVLGGFVKWLWENWQQKMGAAPSTPPPDPEEQRLREAAWRKQTGQGAAPPPRQPAAAPSPWDELRKAWKELQETVKQPSPPARRTARSAPPPVPPSSRRQVPSREVPYQRPPQQQAARPAASAPAVPAVASVPAIVSRPSAPVLAALLNLRRDPALMRQAILMQEILGPPKALQSSSDFAI